MEIRAEKRVNAIKMHCIWKSKKLLIASANSYAMQTLSMIIVLLFHIIDIYQFLFFMFIFVFFAAQMHLHFCAFENCVLLLLLFSLFTLVQVICASVNYSVFGHNLNCNQLHAVHVADAETDFIQPPLPPFALCDLSPSLDAHTHTHTHITQLFRICDQYRKQNRKHR